MLPGLRFFVYTMKVGTFFANPVRESLALDKCGLSTVPVLVGCDHLPFASVEEALEYSKGFSRIAPDGTCVNREGIVVRSFTPDSALPKMSGQFSFKVINPDFAIEHGL